MWDSPGIFRRVYPVSGCTFFSSFRPGSKGSGQWGGGGVVVSHFRFMQLPLSMIFRKGFPGHNGTGFFSIPNTSRIP